MGVRRRRDRRAKTGRARGGEGEEAGVGVGVGEEGGERQDVVGAGIVTHRILLAERNTWSNWPRADHLDATFCLPLPLGAASPPRARRMPSPEPFPLSRPSQPRVSVTRCANARERDSAS